MSHSEGPKMLVFGEKGDLGKFWGRFGVILASFWVANCHFLPFYIFSEPPCISNKVASYIFDTYTPTMEDTLITFLSSLSPDRIIIMAIKDEASTHLKSTARQHIAKLFNSKHIGALAFRSMWALVATTGNSTTGLGPRNLGEKISMSPDKKQWSELVDLQIEVELTGNTIWCPVWGDDNGDDRFVDKRRKFCHNYGGYNSLCRCDRPDAVRFHPENFTENHTHNSGLIIMACDRPHTLYNTLRSVLSAYGANPEKIWVMIDGYVFSKEIQDLASLFGVNCKGFSPRGVKKSRITQHYGSVLRWIFDDDRDLDFEEVIILEDDLEVSPDFFSYFSQAMYLLKEDPSVWCVSAWNDNSFKHTSLAADQLYRVEGMPGLGWMLTRKLFKGELEDKWPEVGDKIAWDNWMRQVDQHQKRECLVPDIPRTYHQASKGNTLPAHFQDDYFNRKHKGFEDTQHPVKLKGLERMSAHEYEDDMYKLVSSSLLVDHTKSPCDKDFLKNVQPGQSYVAYFRMAYDSATEVYGGGF